MTCQVKETIKTFTNTVSVLKSELAEKDGLIQNLQQEVSHLKTAIDDHEQHGRRDSVRIFGMSEETSGSTDDKVLRLCNSRMKLVPPLFVDEISVSHRVGKPKPSSDGSPSPPRPLLVKFATRRSKIRVMEASKKLRLRSETNGDAPDPGPGHGAEETSATSEGEKDDEDDWTADGLKINIADDLTKIRANLAYRARVAKRNHEIMDTWVTDCRSMVKKQPFTYFSSLHFF